MVPYVKGVWRGTVTRSAFPPYGVFYVDDGKRALGQLALPPEQQVIDGVVLIISSQSDPYGYALDLYTLYEEATITGNIQYPGLPPALVAGVVTNANDIALLTAQGTGFNSSMSGKFNTAGAHQGLNGLIRSVLTLDLNGTNDQIYYDTFSLGRYYPFSHSVTSEEPFPEVFLP